MSLLAPLTAQTTATAATVSQTATANITHWLNQPIVKRLLEIGTAALIVIIGWWLSRYLTSLLNRGMERAGMEQTLRSFLRNLAQVLLMLVVVIAALQKTGLVPITSLIAVLSAAGLAIALALKDSLSNIASGVMLIMLRPFKAGDAVCTGGQEGVVEQIRIFHTKLRTYSNEEITLPNSEITKQAIINLTGRDIRRTDIAVGIDYNTPIANARAVLLEIAANTKAVLDEPAPAVLVQSLGESSVDLVLRVWVETPEMIITRSDLLEAVHREFGRAGIPIPFPQRDMHIYHKDANGQPLTSLSLPGGKTAEVSTRNLSDHGG